MTPVVNYKPLNKWTKANKYPLPNMMELTRKLAHAQIFTALDVRSGYNNIRMKQGDEWKAAFITPATRTRPPQHLQPKVMPFGLCNAPATFQKFMNEILAPLIATGEVLCYLDDVLIATGPDITHH